MSGPTHSDIQRDMTDAFSGECRRRLTARAERGLSDFIQEAVIKGVDSLPGSYGQFREYLMCRFKNIASAINQSVGEGKKATWQELIDTGRAEVRRNDRPDCIALIKGPAPKALRICRDFDGGVIKPAMDLDDTP